jgi:hypothetical protein
VEQAREVLAEVVTATSDWRAVAAGHGIARREVDRFADAMEDQRARLRVISAGRA